MKTMLKIFMSCFIATNIQAGCADVINSFIISPRLEETVSTPTPVIIGMARDSKGRAINKGRVSLYLDKRLLAVVETNEYGVWSYAVTKNHALCDGFHCLDANIKQKINNAVWSQPSLFYVQATHAPIENGCGNVNTSNSVILYPFDMSYLNTTKPVIVGQLLDANYAPVSGETVTIKINGSSVGCAQSDNNGVFYYGLVKKLTDGSHTIEAYCVDCQATLSSSFEVYTETPYAPVILTPTSNSLITDGIAFVSGLAEPYAIITSFLDADTYGKISYADESGNWSTHYEVEDGDHVVTARSTDLAGNQSLVSIARLFRAQEIMS